MTVPESWWFIGKIAIFILCYAFACVWIGDRLVSAMEKKRSER